MPGTNPGVPAAAGEIDAAPHGDGTPGPVAAAVPLLPMAVAFAWLVSAASWFWRRNPELQFGWVVLVLTGYLFWEKWEQRPPWRLRWSAGSVLGVAAGLGVLFFAQLYRAAYGVTTEGMALFGTGFLLLAHGNLGFAFGGAGARHFAFVFLFFLVALPVPDTVYVPFVGALQHQVAALNVELLTLAGIPAQAVGSVIQLPHCVVGVDEACSGVRSLQSSVMMALFIGHLVLRSTGLRVTLLVAGIGFSLAGNLARSFFLSWTAHTSGVAAIERFHDAAGWSILAFTTLAVALMAWALHRAEAWAAARPGAELRGAGEGVSGGAR